MRKPKSSAFLILFSILMLLGGTGALLSQKRPMTFMDVVCLNRIRGTALSANRQYFLYEVSSLDWKDNKRYSDLYLSSVEKGPLMQLTFTKRKNESSPKWHPESFLFAFISDRSNKDEIFFMRPDGGEAWQITETKEGVISYDWNSDGSSLAFLSGKDKECQLWLMPGPGGQAQKLTDHKTPVEFWLWSP
ncbi:MAG: TolB family protein, partial [Candidatus Zixiibacteriota bacterium]